MCFEPEWKQFLLWAGTTFLQYYTGRNGTTSPHFEVAPHSCNIILVGMGQPVFLYSYVEIMIMMICFEMYDKCYKKGESVLSNEIEKLELKEIFPIY